jgi:site-specific recombinase XerD
MFTCILFTSILVGSSFALAPALQSTRPDLVSAVKDETTGFGLSKPVHSHSLRHAIAIHLLEAGTNLRCIQIFLGHANLEATAGCLHVADVAVRSFSRIQMLPKIHT